MEKKYDVGAEVTIDGMLYRVTAVSEHVTHDAEGNVTDTAYSYTIQEVTEEK